jgi:acetyltransferase-like isoleucine patch superfamily enzyme
MIDLYKLRDFISKLNCAIFGKIWFLRSLYETKGTASQITLFNFFTQKILGFNRFVPWPVHHRSRVFGIRWIKVGINTAPGLAPGCYIFAKEDSPILIGDYTFVAPNVGIAGFNHLPNDIYSYQSKGGVSIGKYCWLGMNSVVLPGVTLGDHTVVAAGAVVSKSFPEGACILAGNPAIKVKNIKLDTIVKYQHPYEYVGYRRIGKRKI